jgi:hypothetical protein
VPETHDELPFTNRAGLAGGVKEITETGISTWAVQPGEFFAEAVEQSLVAAADTRV